MADKALELIGQRRFTSVGWVKLALSSHMDQLDAALVIEHRLVFKEAWYGRFGPETCPYSLAAWVRLALIDCPVGMFT